MRLWWSRETTSYTVLYTRLGFSLYPRRDDNPVKDYGLEVESGKGRDLLVVT